MSDKLKVFIVTLTTIAGSIATACGVYLGWGDVAMYAIPVTTSAIVMIENAWFYGKPAETK